jgi:uncharacterized membrane protein YjdF
MDQHRQIRFAIPPFFLLASLLWGAYLGGRDLSPIFKPETAGGLIGLLTVATVAIVPLGFLISTVSVLLLRGVAKIAKIRSYEAALSDTTLDLIWDQLRSVQARDKKMTLYATATFDHELLAPGIHTWLLRRWNSFNVAAHSVVALVLAHVAAPILCIRQVCAWWFSTLVLAGILAVTAYNAWRETMKMIEFQSHREQRRPTQAEVEIRRNTKRREADQKTP